MYLNRTLLLTMCCVLLTVSLSQASPNNMPLEQKTRLIVFGDSYSDNGNDYRLTSKQYPNATAYYQGRFSDGPVWAEYFAKKLDIDPNDSTRFINFAYGQAKVLQPTSITVYGDPDVQYRIPSLSEEIDAYERQYGRIHENDIIVVFIATNDFFDITPETTKSFFLKIADQEVAQIKRLIQMGAKQIIVLNGRDVTLSPLAKIIDNKKLASFLKQFRGFIQTYNQRLSAALSSIHEVFLYDIFSFDHQVLKKINHDKMCYQNSKGDYQNVAGPICNNPKQFFYYDRIHTTSAINQLLADDVYNQTHTSLKLPPH